MKFSIFVSIFLLTVRAMGDLSPVLSVPSLTSLSAAQVETQAMELLNTGHQREAEELLNVQVPLHRTSQRVLFLHACCLRSRFMTEEAAPIFEEVAELDEDSIEGRCSVHILCLDARKEEEKHFTAMQKLVEENPGDLLVRWMLAVQCRAYDRNEEGVLQYQELLKEWNPGPALVHQTYGNLLHELKRYEEALAERYLTVRMDPKGWSYQGLGNTLRALERYAEAEAAFEQAVQQDPDEEVYWTQWAWCLMQLERYDEAIAKCRKAAKLDPSSDTAWAYWGRCLELQGEVREAVIKYRKALEVNASDAYSRRRLQALEEWLEHEYPGN